MNAVLAAVRQAADVVCDRWTLVTLLLAFDGTRRFSDFQLRSGMSSRQLTVRLRALEDQGILMRLPYSRRPLRYESQLTVMGRSMLDVFVCMAHWESHWSDARDGVELQVSHDGCAMTSDGMAGGELACAHCALPIRAKDVTGLESLPKRIPELPLKQGNYRRTSNTAKDSGRQFPLAQAIDIVGDKWTIEILVVVFMRVSSFLEIQRLSGISSNILSDRLSRLLKLGALRQTSTTEPGRIGSYRVTDKGMAFYPVLLALQDWADAWLPDRRRSPLRLRHNPCGQRLKLNLRCTACGAVMDSESSHLQWIERAKTE